MELILLRHAENALPGPKQRIFQAFLDETPLTPKGESQAADLARHLTDLPMVKRTLVITSPATRCSATAANIGRSLGIDPLAEQRLCDRLVGARSFNSLKDYRDWQVQSWLSTLSTTRADRIVAVTHGSVIECATSILLRIPSKSMANSFIQCDHGGYHHWSVAPQASAAILLKANVAAGRPSTVVGDPYKKISDRITSARDGAIFVVDKYYVR